MTEGQCLCRTYPGCKNHAEPGQKLCPVCRSEHHRAYTDRQLMLAQALIAKRRALR